MTSTTRFPAMLAAAGALTIASARPANGQIVYPYPPYPAVVCDSSVRLDVTRRGKPRSSSTATMRASLTTSTGCSSASAWSQVSTKSVLYLDGYRSAGQQVYLTPDRTFKMGLQMEPLSPGEVGAVRPVPSPSTVHVLPSRPLPRSPRGILSTSAPPSEAAPGTPDASATGQLTIQVQPADVNVIIDGQAWPASQGQAVVVDLPEGRHVIQIRRSGFVGYSTEVDVRRSETTTVNVALRQQP